MSIAWSIGVCCIGQVSVSIMVSIGGQRAGLARRREIFGDLTFPDTPTTQRLSLWCFDIVLGVGPPFGPPGVPGCTPLSSPVTGWNRAVTTAENSKSG